jgi:hypothetical protein
MTPSDRNWRVAASMESSSSAADLSTVRNAVPFNRSRQRPCLERVRFHTAGARPPPPPPPPGCTPDSPDPACRPEHFCGLSKGTPVYGIRCCRILGGCEGDPWSLRLRLGRCRSVLLRRKCAQRAHESVVAKTSGAETPSGSGDGSQVVMHSVRFELA